MRALQVRSHGSLRETRWYALTECVGVNADSNFCGNTQTPFDLDQKEQTPCFCLGAATM